MIPGVNQILVDFFEIFLCQQTFTVSLQHCQCLSVLLQPLAACVKIVVHDISLHFIRAYRGLMTFGMFNHQSNYWKSYKDLDRMEHCYFRRTCCDIF